MLKIDKKDEQKVYDSIGKAIEEFSVEKIKSANIDGRNIHENSYFVRSCKE